MHMKKINAVLQTSIRIEIYLHCSEGMSRLRSLDKFNSRAMPVGLFPTQVLFYGSF